MEKWGGGNRTPMGDHPREEEVSATYVHGPSTFQVKSDAIDVIRVTLPWP